MLQWSRHGLSKAAAARGKRLASTQLIMIKCVHVRLEPNPLGDSAVMSGLARMVPLLSKQHRSADRRLKWTTKLNVGCDLADFVG